MKERILRFLGSGTFPGMDNGKKFAIQVANFDVFFTVLTLNYYIFFSPTRHIGPMFTIHMSGMGLVLLGFYLIRSRHYDLGRYVLHFNGLSIIFFTVDSFKPGSGFELYYFANIITPFLMFSLEEHLKGLVLSICSCIVFIVQFSVGTGLLFKVVASTRTDKLEAIIFIMTYLIVVLSLIRWQLNKNQKMIEVQQAEMIHSSNLIALGEMAGSIAHEINNPLQSLTLHSDSLKRNLSKTDFFTEKVKDQFQVIDHTISRVAQMVKGLRNLSRNVTYDPLHFFSMEEVIEEVKLISFHKIEGLDIEWRVSGDQSLLAFGNLVQVSQVLINLLNNSIDALELLPEKWIHINIYQQGDIICLSVTDSGKGISEEVAKKMMRPFFTTKGPNKGTGLGLSISKSIMEKCGGSLYYEKSSGHTRFVMNMPICKS